MRKISVLLLAGAAVMVASPAVLAADLYIAPPPTGVVYAPAPAGDWAGFYIGGHLGIGAALADHQPTTPPASHPDGFDFGLQGHLAGVQAGANFYLSDGVVGGIEADFSWANIAGGDNFVHVGPPFPSYDFDIVHSIDWTGSFRGRIGFDAGQFMPYLTAGLAFAQATRDVTSNATPADTQMHIGWTAGAGVDVMVADQISLNLEYRYSDFGTAEYATGGTPPTIGLTSHAVRGGINFHF